jgi:hypothetical protein
MMISHRRFPSILALLVSLGVFLSAAFANASSVLTEADSMRAALVKDFVRKHPKKAKKVAHKVKSAKSSKKIIAKVKHKNSKRSLHASKKKGNRVIASLGKMSSRRSR